MSTRFCILGTAGHIDHGKSSLVKALTGTDPDRLPEEKARGMTIELGFAHLRLPGDGGDEPIDVGIVDVPGHERFVRTMVAGATGVDIAMLLVAADDGVMPQTREHIEILDLLGVSRGLIALSKIDLVSGDRIEAIRKQIEETVSDTVLKDWPVMPVSVRTGAGLHEIRGVIRKLLSAAAPARPSDIFRLAIDRVFTIHGRGTVVTGSVLSGRAAPGTALELQPAGVACKVREVQSHGAVVDGAVGGQRAALNLTGIEKESIERGMELATPGYLLKSRYVDARVRALARLEKPLASHQRVRVSMGTSEAMAMLVVIGGDAIAPGQSALVQLRFLSPVVAAFGQRFILRNETAQFTIGGGDVVRPVSRRLRPRLAEAIESVRRAASADPFERFSEAIRLSGFDTPGDLRLACDAGLEPEGIASYRARMTKEGAMIRVGAREVHRDVIGAVERRALQFLKRHHALKPVEPGVAKDRFVGWIGLKSAAGMGREIFARLEQQGLLSVRGPYVAHRDFRPAMSAEDAALMAQLTKEIAAAGFDPPEWSKLRTIAPLSKQRSKQLEDLAKTEPSLLAFAPQLFISTEAMERFKAAVAEIGSGGRKFKLADVRDRLSLTRRVVQPLLEHLDRVHVTRRVGDERVLLEPHG